MNQPTPAVDVKFEMYCEELRMQAEEDQLGRDLEEHAAHLAAYQYGRKVQRCEEARKARGRVFSYILCAFGGFAMGLVVAGMMSFKFT